MLRSTATLFLLVLLGFSSAEFEDHFKNCHPDVSGFDACLREALNAIRPYFKTGVEKYNLPPFDPFFAREISTSRGMPNFGFTLTLRNVTESGWSSSKVTKFVSDLPNNKVVYTQSFPEKALAGMYEFNFVALGTTYNNRGRFTLTLYDLIQTTTISKEPNRKLQVRVNVQTIRDLKLHITNLFFGRQILEGVIDRVINGAWQPGFVVTRGLINDLVSIAFTEIFGNAFSNFPFEKIIMPRNKSSQFDIANNQQMLTASKIVPKSAVGNVSGLSDALLSLSHDGTTEKIHFSKGSLKFLNFLRI